MNQSFSKAEIKERLESLLGAVLTTRRTASEPAQQISRFDRATQEFTLHWAGVIAKSNSEMAYQFVCHTQRAFELLDTDGVTQWIIAAMDIYDRDGLYLGSAALRDVETFASRLIQDRHSVAFNEIVNIMNKFVIGVSGRNLAIDEDDAAWTDTETIFLPHSVKTFDSDRKNFELYKATVGFLLAQTRYGTFRVDKASGVPIICAEIARYRDPVKALKIFEMIEEKRLLASLEREFPGLARQMKALKQADSGVPPIVVDFDALGKIQRDGADVLDSLAVVRDLYRNAFEVPDAACYQGIIDLERVRLVTKQRVEAERKKFRTDLAMLTEGAMSDDETGKEGMQRESFEVSYARDSEEVPGSDDEMSFVIDGELVVPPEDVIQTARSIIQDFGEIPEEYLTVAKSGLYDPGQSADDDDLEKTDSATDTGISYDEWDYRRGHYRKNWCSLRETDMHPGNESSVTKILEKYSHLIRDIRKSFEALRGDDRMLRRQSNGDDIDIDAVVESYVDVVKGEEITDRLFIKSRQLERDLAVIFMVDVSGSTKGWINEAERESLVLLSEALETLGDRYAIYGFSGMTRKRCEVYRIKRFDEPYNGLVKARIAGIKPQDYTRMGVVIRHLCEKLKRIDAKTRVLITVSDGKPDDYDGYRGEYGIEDTRQALLEAKYAGIHPFCITIDTHAHGYLPHMYGHVNYTVVSDIRKLPLKVSDIYRKLTT